jgi:hypothetical protein
MNLVTDQFPNIAKWPSHDIFNDLSTINQLDRTTKLSIFPNPSNGFIRIYRTEKIKSTEVQNLIGQIAYSETTINELQKNIHLDHLPMGLYLVKVNFEKNYIVQNILLN